MKRIEYIVFQKLWHLAKVVAWCGGSDNVRYGREGPETRFVAELGLQPGDSVWIFVKVQGEHRVAVQIRWDDLAWPSMAMYGIQPADCPPDVWSGTAAPLRERNIPAEWLMFERALAQHIKVHPGTTTTQDFAARE